MTAVRLDAINKLRRKLPGDAADAGIIRRADLVDAIYTELVHRLQTEGVPATGILTMDNYPAVLEATSLGAAFSINVSRLQNLQTIESFEVNNFIKASRDVSVDNLIDTLLAIVFKMTALRRSIWSLITDPNNATAVTVSEPYLTMLDLDAQLWYNELDDLARRYNMDTGTDLVGTNGTSVGENAAYLNIENTGVIKRLENGVPIDFSNAGLRPYCITTERGILGLAQEGSTAQLTDSLGEAVFCAYSDDLQLIQLNVSADPKKIFVVQSADELDAVTPVRGDYGYVITGAGKWIFDGAEWQVTTSLKNLAGLSPLSNGKVFVAKAINAYTSYSSALGNPPTFTTHAADPGFYQLITDLRVLLFRHRDESPVVDLTSCHSNCHGNCHSSRNRR